VNKVEEILSRFDPITLQEMDNVKLQDRIDTKFLLTESVFFKVLNELQKDYSVLEISGKRFNHYETLYFDTEDFQLYLKHHNGRLNRYKIRSRRYVESDLHFFEVKFKNSKGRTIKERIKRNEIVTEITSNPKAAAFLKEASGLLPESLKPQLWVNYMRITFVNKHTPERLTIDMKLNYAEGDRGIPYTGLVIAEVKQGSVKDKSPFISLMHQFHVRQQSISKYCLGVITLFPSIKKNNFKPTLLYIQKLLKAS
jgi:hypothetical protein